MPSFKPQTKFTIDLKNRTLHQYAYYQLKDFDSNSSKDSLLVVYDSIFEIEEATFNEFLNESKSFSLDSNVVSIVPMLDGIGFKVSKILSNNDTISLSSNIMRRNEESLLQYEFLDAFFNLSYNTIVDYDGVVIIENIQDCFSYGLPIKKVDNNSTEYRIWGSISGCREDNKEFINFLENLPDDENILFDLRNGSIAYCLNGVLEEFGKKKLIYFYGDRSGTRSKEIMDEIKLAEKNGEVLNSLRVSAYETHKKIYEDWKNNQFIKSFLTKKEVLKFISENEIISD